MIKITHFGKFYPPDMGGTEYVTQSLAVCSADQGHNVSVVCFDQRGPGGCNKIDGVDVIRFRVQKKINSQPLSIRYFFELIKAGRKSDIVHLHAPNIVALIASFFIGFRPRLLVHWHTDIVNKGLIAYAIAPLEWVMLKRATIVVATSELYVQSSSRLRAFRNKIRVIPLGIDAISPISKVDLSQKYSEFVGKKKIILCVGRLSKYKGFTSMIEAAKYLPSEVVVIIAGDGELRYELSENIRESKLQDKVLLAGRVSQDELCALYNNACIFCLPSIFRSEAFGVVILEAMAHALPVVACNIPGSGVSWVNQHLETGLNVEPNSPRELAEACTRIISDDHLRESFSIAAFQRYREFFTADIFRKKSLELYEELFYKNSES